jgi:iron-sulfur cluster repair protein YtfE (RIC family)
MLTRIGKAPAAGDVVDALLDCHQRIRDFIALSLRLAATQGSSPAEIAETAASLHRYFAVALPLHAQDEEESLLPRLEGVDPEVDRELAEMMREHAEHGNPLERLLAVCSELRASPGELPRLAPLLAAAARELERHFDAHLSREERVIFPAIRAHLDPATQATIQAEMKARRGVAS